MDLSNYAAASGTYTIPVSIKVENAGDIGVTGTYHAQVTIREQAEEQPEADGAQP